MVAMFKIFKTFTLPEEMRLAAFTVIIEHPKPFVLMACAQMLRIEPSPTIRRFVYDSLLAMTTSGLSMSPEM